MFSEKKAGELGDLNHKNRFSVNNSPSQPRLSEQKKKQILSQNRVHKEMINANAHHLRCLSHTLGALSAGIQDFCCLLHNDFNLFAWSDGASSPLQLSQIFPFYNTLLYPLHNFRDHIRLFSISEFIAFMN